MFAPKADKGTSFALPAEANTNAEGSRPRMELAVPNGNKSAEAAKDKDGSLIDLDTLDNQSIKKRLAGWNDAERYRRNTASVSANNLPIAPRKLKNTEESECISFDSDDEDEDAGEGALRRVAALHSSQPITSLQNPLRRSKLEKKNAKIKKKREMIQSLSLELQRNETVVQDLKKKQIEMEEEFQLERRRWYMEKKHLLDRLSAAGGSSIILPENIGQMEGSADNDGKEDEKQEGNEEGSIGLLLAVAKKRRLKRSKSFTSDAGIVSSPNLPTFRNPDAGGQKDLEPTESSSPTTPCNNNNIDTPAEEDESEAFRRMLGPKRKNPLRLSKDDLSLEGLARIREAADNSVKRSKSGSLRVSFVAEGVSSDDDSMDECEDEVGNDDTSRGEEEWDEEAPDRKETLREGKRALKGSDELFSSLASGNLAMSKRNEGSKLKYSSAVLQAPRSARLPSSSSSPTTVTTPTPTPTITTTGPSPPTSAIAPAQARLRNPLKKSATTERLKAGGDWGTRSHTGETSSRSLQQLTKLHGQFGISRRKMQLTMEEVNNSLSLSLSLSLMWLYFFINRRKRSL